MSPSEPAPASGAAPADPRQRWRVAYRRDPEAAGLPQREEAAAWEAALRETGLPLAEAAGPRPRPRLAFGPPLPLAMIAELELVDIYLAARQPRAEVRRRLTSALPVGHVLIDLHDVWLGEPPLAGRVVAADYRVELLGPLSSAARARLNPAVDALLGARSLPRERRRGDRSIAYDLRPLLLDLALADLPSGGPVLRMRLRFDPEAGVGRPDEVLAALSEASGAELTAARVVRERLWLTDESPPAL